MFKIFGLSDEEKQILRYMCLIPLSGVKKSDFKRWAGLKSPSIVTNLIDRSWIIENTNGIALHPIVHDIIKHSIPLTDDRIFLNIVRDIDDFKYRNMNFDEICRYAKIFEFICNDTLEIDLKYNDEYHSIVYVLNHAERFSCSINLSLSCVNMAKMIFGENSICVAKWYFRLFDIYKLFQNKQSEFDFYADEAMNLLKPYKNTDIDAIYILAHHATHRLPCEEILLDCITNIELHINQKGILIPNGYLLQGDLFDKIAMLYYNKGNYHDALTYALKAKKVFCEAITYEKYLLAWQSRALLTLARIYSKIPNETKALDAAQTSILSAKKYYGDNHYLIDRFNFYLCEIYMNLNKQEEALQLLTKLRNTLDRKGDIQNILYPSINNMIFQLENCKI